MIVLWLGRFLEWGWWIRALWMEIDREEAFISVSSPQNRRLLAIATKRWKMDARSSVVSRARVVKDLQAIAEREERAKGMREWERPKILRPNF